MRRDDWKLGNGLKNNDEAFFYSEGGIVRCKVIKVRGWGPLLEEGNVLIEIEDKQMWVVGSKLTPIPERH